MISFSLLLNAGCKRALDTEPSTQPDAEPVPVQVPPYRVTIPVYRGYARDIVYVSINKPQLSLGAFKHSLVRSMCTAWKEYRTAQDPCRLDGARGAGAIEIFIEYGHDVPLVRLPDHIDVADLSECVGTLRYFVRRELEPGCECCQCGTSLGQAHIATSDPRAPGTYWCFRCARKNHIAHENAAWDTVAMDDKCKRVVLLAPVGMFFALHAVVVDCDDSIDKLKALVCAKLGAPPHHVSGLTLIYNSDYMTGADEFYGSKRIRNGTVKSYVVSDCTMVHYALPPVAQ